MAVKADCSCLTFLTTISITHNPAGHIHIRSTSETVSIAKDFGLGP